MNRICTVVILQLLSICVDAQNLSIIFDSKSEPVTGLNTASDENSVSINPVSGQIVFTRKNFAGNVGGIENPGGIWMSQGDSAFAVNLEEHRLNTSLGFVNKGQYFLFGSVRYETGIYVSEVMIGEFDGDQVMDFEKLNVKYLKNISQHFSGSISSDGKHMVLAMEGVTTYGVEDLYVTHLQKDGSWSPPKNLGYGINTAVQEYTPFISADNKTLIFATNGRDGFGSFDLFLSERLDDTWQNWSQPINLGASINTTGAEMSFAFLPDGEFAYYVSTTDSDGYGDIRRIKIKNKIEDLTDSVEIHVSFQEAIVFNKVIMLVDRKSGEPVDGSIMVTTDSTKQLEKSPFVIKADQFGDIEIEVSLAGYMNEQWAVTSNELTNEDTVRLIINPLTVGSTIQLEHVLFYQGTANMIEGSERELNRVVEVMQNNPALKIELKGHTDNQGDSQLNLDLSRERVRVVQKYILDEGIDHQRLSGKGYGGNQPLVANDSEENRKLNRRVEFTVIAN